MGGIAGVKSIMLIATSLMSAIMVAGLIWVKESLERKIEEIDLEHKKVIEYYQVLLPESALCVKGEHYYVTRR